MHFGENSGLGVQSTGSAIAIKLQSLCSAGAVHQHECAGGPADQCPEQLCRRIGHRSIPALVGPVRISTRGVVFQLSRWH
jgi:hypothetical protein